jgi:hypothetical protein
MARRPIFVPGYRRECPVAVIEVEFPWRSGNTPLDKKLNVIALHRAGQEAGPGPLLEISTKSEEGLGRALSAFNLVVYSPTLLGPVTLEGVYQGSKVFEAGGPYRDLYTRAAWDVKSDRRLYTSGKVVGFDYYWQKWPLEPKTLFYDWLYLQGLVQFPKALKALILRNYQGFTDIEFNPQRGINCQARSCALALTFERLGLLTPRLNDQAYFLNLYEHLTA